MNENLTDVFTDSELAKIILQVVGMLCDKKLVSHDPTSVQIKRQGRGRIYPCRRSSGRDVLDLSQLRWADEKGQFWFMGPIKSLVAVIDKNPIRGQLELGPNKMTFVTQVNTLNFDDFEAAMQRKIELSEQLGLQAHFAQAGHSYNVNLSLFFKRHLSLLNVNEFLERIVRLLTESM